MRKGRRRGNRQRWYRRVITGENSNLGKVHDIADLVSVLVKQETIAPLKAPLCGLYVQEFNEKRVLLIARDLSMKCDGTVRWKVQT
jgi:hypothetical protein